MLACVAASPRIMAPMEVFSSLAESPSVGSTLIQKGGYSSRFACGFNGGTIGIPNLREHSKTLFLIRTIITNYLEKYGRSSFQWVDQEVANYVAYCIGGFDTHTLLRYVRYGWEGCEYRADQRIGMVHFFPARGPISKSQAMKTYSETLRAVGS